MDGYMMKRVSVIDAFEWVELQQETRFIDGGTKIQVTFVTCIGIVQSVFEGGIKVAACYAAGTIGETKSERGSIHFGKGDAIEVGALFEIVVIKKGSSYARVASEVAEIIGWAKEEGEYARFFGWAYSFFFLKEEGVSVKKATHLRMQRMLI